MCGRPWLYSLCITLSFYTCYLSLDFITANFTELNSPQCADVPLRNSSLAPRSTVRSYGIQIVRQNTEGGVQTVSDKRLRVRSHGMDAERRALKAGSQHTPPAESDGAVIADVAYSPGASTASASSVQQRLSKRAPAATAGLMDTRYPPNK